VGVQLHAFLTAALNAGELHGLSVLPPRKGPPVLTAKETRWDPEPISTFRRREIIYFLPEMEPRFLGRPARGLVIIPTTSFSGGQVLKQYAINR